MNLYDGVIERIAALLSAAGGKELEDNAFWKSASDHSMILRSDMAYELGGEGLPAIGATLVTTGEGVMVSDGITLIGRDLSDIKQDVPYARISLVLTDDASLGEGNDLYRRIRAIEGVRFSFYPEGFMQRISASRGIESVRVSKAALKKGLDFAAAGTILSSAFKRLPGVKAVHTFFITDEGFDFKALSALVKEGEDITKTIDHILKNAVMDCTVCSLQEVCSEVEGLRKMHFSLERS